MPFLNDSLLVGSTSGPTLQTTAALPCRQSACRPAKLGWKANRLPRLGTEMGNRLDCGSASPLLPRIEAYVA